MGLLLKPCDLRSAVAAFVNNMNARPDCELPHHLAALGVLLLRGNDALGWKALIEDLGDDFEECLVLLVSSALIARIPRLAVVFRRNLAASQPHQMTALVRIAALLGARLAAHPLLQVPDRRFL